MGAESFVTYARGKTVKEAFDNAVREARYEHGHGGYTGTIAEKDGFRYIPVPAGVSPKDFIRRIENDVYDNNKDPYGYEDKWGPALCVEVEKDLFCFFGLASS